MDVGTSLLANLQTQLGAISVIEALRMLRDFKCDTEEVLATGAAGNYKTNPWKITADYSDEYPAAGIGPMTFCGGPPGQSYWYTGSLLMFVIDRILYQIASHKVRHKAQQISYYYHRNKVKVRVSG
jgi:hypothetical protein